MNNFFTLDYLGTFAGIVAIITLIIQFTKMPLDRIWKIPTRFVVWVLSYILLVAVSILTDNFTAEMTVLNALNAVLVAWTAMGAYEVTFKKIESRNQS